MCFDGDEVLNNEGVVYTLLEKRKKGWVFPTRVVESVEGFRVLRGGGGKGVVW